ncbi:hydrolase [Staphylococcus hyicus]|uniref:HAD-IIB family hydrolase n=2 Tax=Staphylococcus hyicus TaxID=1284 RepID=A0A0A8HPA8_STAHY|nr:HAD-IIB family hydrolase [Staphylococcus hyicus]AJC95470.1 hydrolase [Staphylococcus hyicus]MCQ9291478.1 HAD-IIB family hydrolase [Staphylococcus hyicus]MCQ9300375.1 HAD-IIB family hydrolase [Staphylococcus hyicus]MCQ9306719.1 HAD-IIB family hydrolase [Staphylococcus hyicus]MCQ9309132.1 HAD-IIB family hydrolase [Staphylococcus hyicus]
MTRKLLLFDFDETYYKHQPTSSDIEDMKDLEQLLTQLSKEGVIVAILTGSALASVLSKMAQTGMTFKPHYIATDLSSKLYTWNGKGYEINETYQNHVLSSTFELSEIQQFITAISHKYQVSFDPQKLFHLRDTHYNYYFYSQGNEAEDVRILEDLIQLAQSKRYVVRYNRCNPRAGDPENAYDVDFLPQYAGKKYAAKFLMSLYDIPKSQVLGFGDSGNDREFLRFLHNRFVMCNSTDPSMISQFEVTKHAYYKGLMYHIKDFINQT